MGILMSMTGFARESGTLADGTTFAWELRSVNGRGLDLRLRLPNGQDALEPALREATGKRLKRGNVSASLTLKREERPRLAVDKAALEQALAPGARARRPDPRQHGPGRRGAAGPARRHADRGGGARRGAGGGQARAPWPRL